jgi:hypothetical protein
VIRTSVKSLWINSSFLAKRLFLNTFYAHTRIDIFFHRYLFIYFVFYLRSQIFLSLHYMAWLWLWPIIYYHCYSISRVYSGMM